MNPIKMLYNCPSENIENLPVDVYDINYGEDFTPFALCWNPAGEYWMLLSIHTLRPVYVKKKKRLDE